MVTIKDAATEDAGEILSLQKLAYQSEAKIYNDWSLPALTQTLDSLIAEFSESLILKGTIDNKIIASVRAMINCGTCEIGRLIVHPEHQNKGIGTELLNAIEKRHPNIEK